MPIPSVRPILAVSLFALAPLAACSHQGPREFDVTPVSETVAPPEAPAADLAGTWDFNPRASDQPGQMGRGGMSGMPGGGGMGGRGGRPGGGGMPGGGRGGFPGGSGGMPGGGGRPEGAPGARGGEGGGAAVVGNALRLVISQTDTSVTITRPNGAAFTLYFDGRDVIVPGRTDDEAIQVSGRWHRRRFEVRREISTQRTVTESFEISSDGSKLTVRTQITGEEGVPRGMPGLRRVYDRAPPRGERGPEPGAASPGAPPAAGSPPPG